MEEYQVGETVQFNKYMDKKKEEREQLKPEMDKFEAALLEESKNH